MSGQSSEEKTEPPTPRRIKKAREEGQVAHSRDVTKAAVFLAVGMYLMFRLGHIFDVVGALAVQALTWPQLASKRGHAELLGIASKAFGLLGLEFLAIVAVAFFAGMVADFAQVGPLVATKVLQVDFNRINPSSGFKRIFSLKTFSNLGLMLVKALLIGAVFVMVIYSYSAVLIALPSGDVGAALGVGLGVLAGFYLWSVLASGVVSVADYKIQHFIWLKEMYMTKTEIKQERLESFGNPLIKKEIRRMQDDSDTVGKMLKNVRFCQVMVVDDENRVLGLYFNARFKPEPLVIVVASGQAAKLMLAEAEMHKRRVVRDADFIGKLFVLAQPGAPVPKEHQEAALQLINAG
jgi:flagellar biosynthesis protein FlhB